MTTLREYLRLFLFRWFGYDPKPKRDAKIKWTVTMEDQSGKVFIVPFDMYGGNFRFSIPIALQEGKTKALLYSFELVPFYKSVHL